MSAYVADLIEPLEGKTPFQSFLLWWMLAAVPDWSANRYGKSLVFSYSHVVSYSSSLFALAVSKCELLLDWR